MTIYMLLSSSRVANIYIYIYICVCVCVCVKKSFKTFFLKPRECSNTGQQSRIKPKRNCFLTFCMLASLKFRALERINTLVIWYTFHMTIFFPKHETEKLLYPTVLYLPLHQLSLFVHCYRRKLLKKKTMFLRSVVVSVKINSRHYFWSVHHIYDIRVNTHAHTTHTYTEMPVNTCGSSSICDFMFTIAPALFVCS